MGKYLEIQVKNAHSKLTKNINNMCERSVRYKREIEHGMSKMHEEG